MSGAYAAPEEAQTLGVAAGGGEAGMSEPVRLLPPVERWGVHETHCCAKHGCQYSGMSDEGCPVAQGHTSQEYPCEQCGEPGEVTGSLVVALREALAAVQAAPADGAVREEAAARLVEVAGEVVAGFGTPGPFDDSPHYNGGW